jgi:hypothetical protein
MNTLDSEEVLDNPFDTVPETEIGGEDPFGKSYNPFDDEEIDAEESEENEESLDGESESKEDVPAPVAKKPKPVENKKATKEEVLNKVDAGRAILQYLAERKGIADEIDFSTIKTEEDIADLVEAIDEFDQNQALENVKSVDKNIGRIIDYLQAGGDKNRISDLLVEQREVLELDVTTEDGAKSLLRQYYKNVLGFEDDAINKRINRFINNGQLQEEAEDIKPLYDKNIEARQEELIEQARLNQQKEKQLLRNRQQDFVKLLQDNKVSKSVAQNYYQVAFGQRELQDGTKISELDYKFQIMQRNPNNYLKLVEFMADPNLYDKKILQNKANAQVNEQHNKRINFNSNKSPGQDEPIKENKPKFKF